MEVLLASLHAQAFPEVFRRSPDGVVITDAQVRIVDVNPAYERMTGYGRDELLGQNPRLLKSGKTPPAVYQEMWAALRTLGTWQGTFINRRKSGDEFHAFFSTVVIGSPQAPAGYIGFMRDITPMVREREELARRVVELRRTQQVTVRTLAMLAEHRDPTVAGHLERVRRYSLRLAEILRDRPGWNALVDEAFLEGLATASLLHDVGKVGIPEGILFKPATLNAAERAVVELHPVIGAEILQRADETLRRELGLSQTFLSMAVEVVMHHHERWDGSGYPGRLKGRAIPAAARIVALADVYDALTTRRVWRDAVDPREAADFIRARAGSHFDPEVVAAFDRVAASFDPVARGARASCGPPGRPPRPKLT